MLRGIRALSVPTFPIALAFLFGACGSDDAANSSPDTKSANTPDANPGDDGGADDDGSVADTSDGGADAACSGGGGGSIGGPADLFPCDSVWYRDVSQDSVAPESSGLLMSLPSFGVGGLLIDFSMAVMHADASTPRASFPPFNDANSDDVSFPVPNGGHLQGETGYTCTGSGDCYLLVVDDANKKLFEAYGASQNGASWSATSLSVWDLTRHYDNRGRGLGCVSGDSAGLPVAVGLIGLRETRAGKIEHALRLNLPNASVQKSTYVPPATHGAATATATGLPLGTRLRLKASFSDAGITSPGGRAVVAALKKYGAILADTNTHSLLFAEDDSVASAQDPTLTWSGVVGDKDLNAITPSDFEVVDFGSPQTTNTCTRAP